jgi:hypothetical protein
MIDYLQTTVFLKYWAVLDYRPIVPLFIFLSVLLIWLLSVTNRIIKGYWVVEVSFNNFSLSLSDCRMPFCWPLGFKLSASSYDKRSFAYYRQYVNSVGVVFYIVSYSDDVYSLLATLAILWSVHLLVLFEDSVIPVTTASRGRRCARSSVTSERGPNSIPMSRRRLSRHRSQPQMNHWSVFDDYLPPTDSQASSASYPRSSSASLGTGLDQPQGSVPLRLLSPFCLQFRRRLLLEVNRRYRGLLVWAWLLLASV